MSWQHSAWAAGGHCTKRGPCPRLVVSTQHCVMGRFGCWRGKLKLSLWKLVAALPNHT